MVGIAIGVTAIVLGVLWLLSLLIRATVQPLPRGQPAVAPRPYALPRAPAPPPAGAAPGRAHQTVAALIAAQTAASSTAGTTGTQRLRDATVLPQTVTLAEALRLLITDPRRGYWIADHAHGATLIRGGFTPEELTRAAAICQRKQRALPTDVQKALHTMSGAIVLPHAITVYGEHGADAMDLRWTKLREGKGEVRA